MEYHKSSEAYTYGVRQVHGACRSRIGGSARPYQAAHRRTSQAGRSESKSTGPEAQEESHKAFRLGPRRSPLIDGFRFGPLAGDFGPSQTLSYDLSDDHIKAVTVVHLLRLL